MLPTNLSSNIALDQLEAAYKASLVQDDAPAMRPKVTRPSGKASRKEYPLFDINPQTAWEFIERALSEKGISGVTFQQENELFSPWKKEAEAENALSTPSSFADALLRKLAIHDEKDVAKSMHYPSPIIDTKYEPGPGKPKLTARNKENKTAWKIEKIPTIPSIGLRGETKSLFGCTLWRLYDERKNPLQPVKYVLLARDEQVIDQAMKLGIPTTTIYQTKARLLEEYKQHDNRHLSGLVEQEFPKMRAVAEASGHEITRESRKDDASPNFLNTPGSNGSSPESMALNSATTETAAYLATPRVNLGLMSMEKSQDATLALEVENINNTQDGKVSVEDQIAKMFEVMLQQNDPRNSSETDTELESDEEIIVFNPRNRRTSAALGSSSRPGSSGGFIPKPYHAGVQVTSRPASSLGPDSRNGRIQALLKNDKARTASASPPEPSSVERLHSDNSITEATSKASVDSKLKAQSPVFVPGKPSGISAATGEKPDTATGVAPPTGPRLSTPNNQAHNVSAKGNGQEFLRMQQENGQRMIQRQREVIQRQSRTTEKGDNPQRSASPRIITMQPTNNPTIIDPDVYDRSYVVQAPTKPAARHNGEKRRARGNNNRNITRDSPKVHPKHSGMVADPDVEYVLTSGAPRAAARGRGKLWTP